LDGLAYDRALRDKLKDVIEVNKSLGRALGVENLQRLHVERALLKKERELLTESEEGRLSRVECTNNRYETDHGRSGETEKRG